MISYSIRCDLCHEDFRGRSTNSVAFVRELAKEQGWNMQIQSWSTDVCPECAARKIRNARREESVPAQRSQTVSQ